MILNEEQKEQNTELEVTALNGKKYNFERTGKFDYLGVTIINNNKKNRN